MCRTSRCRGFIVLAIAMLGVLGCCLTGCGGGGSAATAPVSSVTATTTQQAPDGVGTIGAAGGTVNATQGSTAGSRVVVPPGALAVDVTIRIMAGANVASAGFQTFGPAVRLEPSGTTFGVPVIVTIPYLGALPAGTPTSALVILHRDDGTGSVRTLTPLSVDTVNHLLTFELSSFSTVQAALRTTSPSPTPTTSPSPSPPGPRLFVADAGNARVVKVDDMLGNGFTAFSGIPSPEYVALDSQGRIYFTGAGQISRMDDMQGTNLTTYAPSGPLPQDNLYPSGIALDAQNRIYVASGGPSASIVRLDDMLGTNRTSYLIPAAGPGPVQPRGVSLDAGGRIYFTDAFRSSTARVVRIDDMSGTNFVSYGRNNMGTGPFNFVLNVFVSSRHIYVSDDTRLVRMDDMAGTNFTVFDGVSPLGIFVDGNERIYFTDRLANTLNRMDDMSGANLITLGTTGTGTNQFNVPMGLAGR